ncbi:unnamed protein product [Cylicocyclus nassatus]|uniref:Uncharacterized protein n=1 Tax=Cylicocyclus nassatus TaxID=53992 RepID=A0AA36DR14_CYLNA|nr:unnamed protein product [Cylicocyclus nassatus]
MDQVTQTVLDDLETSRRPVLTSCTNKMASVLHNVTTTYHPDSFSNASPMQEYLNEWMKENKRLPRDMYLSVKPLNTVYCFIQCMCSTLGCPRYKIEMKTGGSFLWKEQTYFDMLIQLALIFYLVGKTLSHNPIEQQVAADTAAISSVAKVRRPRQVSSKVSQKTRDKIEGAANVATNVLNSIADMLNKIGTIDSAPGGVPIMPGASGGIHKSSSGMLVRSRGKLKVFSIMANIHA